MAIKKRSKKEGGQPDNLGKCREGCRRGNLEKRQKKPKVGKVRKVPRRKPTMR